MDNVSRTHSSRRRTSSASVTPNYRRPFWAKNTKSLWIYQDNNRSLLAGPRTQGDFGLDNFSYDQTQVTQWLMPEGLQERLPSDLLDKTENWQKAGAALCTALDRIFESSKNAVNAAYPSTPSKFVRRTSEQAMEGAEASPIDSPLSPAPIFASAPPMFTLPNVHIEKSAQQLPVKQEIGMESPPYTPFDSFACSTPVTGSIHDNKSIAALADLSRIDTELTPLSSFSSNESGRTIAGYDELSWDYYTKHFEEEIRDCETALQRLKGYARTVDIDLIELSHVTKPETKLMYLDMIKWWEGMKPKVKKLEERVQDLEVPKLEDVSYQWEQQVKARAVSSPASVR